MFTKYGYTIIGIISILSFVLIAASFFIQNNPVKIFLIAVAVISLIFTLVFFRDPDRTAPDRDDVIVSPADGKVLFVKEMDEKKFVGEKVSMISIFMSPLNVHVNRIPVDGIVDYLHYYEGEYIAAFEDKASDSNEESVAETTENSDASTPLKVTIGVPVRFNASIPRFSMVKVI